MSQTVNNWSWATMSDDEKYRYALGRRLLARGGYVLWIMLNPSTADHKTDDPTMRSVKAISSNLGFSAVVVCNLFAYRATDPKSLNLAADPIGPANDHYILNYALGSEKIICAWGSHGHLFGRGDDVRTLLTHEGYPLWALGFTKAGQPKHPLYLRRDTQLVKWEELP